MSSPPLPQQPKSGPAKINSPAATTPAPISADSAPPAALSVAPRPPAEKTPTTPPTAPAINSLYQSHPTKSPPDIQPHRRSHHSDGNKTSTDRAHAPPSIYAAYPDQWQTGQCENAPRSPRQAILSPADSIAEFSPSAEKFNSRKSIKLSAF